MGALRIGLVYDLLGTHPRRPGDPPDADAEYEPIETLEALEAALRRLGHEPLRLGSPHALLTAAGRGRLPQVDAALPIAEGHSTRNREAWAPVLLELCAIPQLGSDALTLSLSLDKAWTKDVVAAAGVATPPYAVLRSAEQAAVLDPPAAFPLFVKPRYEGTAKGIGPHSRADDRAGLVAAVRHVVEGYRQPALVEAFLPGAEYTVTVVGHDPPRALPVLQRALERSTGIGLHAVERHPAPAGRWAHYLPGALDAVTEGALQERALAAFQALECRDFARADFRLCARGQPQFLEINPLPTFARDGSFAVLAELEGRPLEALLADVLSEGLRRLGLAAGERPRATRPR